jgi:hypothetical protein
MNKRPSGCATVERRSLLKVRAHDKLTCRPQFRRDEAGKQVASRLEKSLSRVVVANVVPVSQYTTKLSRYLLLSSATSLIKFSGRFAFRWNDVLLSPNYDSPVRRRPNHWAPTFPPRPQRATWAGTLRRETQLLLPSLTRTGHESGLSCQSASAAACPLRPKTHRRSNLFFLFRLGMPWVPPRSTEADA